MLYKFPFTGRTDRKKKSDKGSGDETGKVEEDYTVLMKFVIGDLGLRLCDFYDMPLNEILISQLAWQSKRDREVLDVQFVAYHAMVGSHLNPKSLPSFEKFISKIDDRPIEKASDEQKERLLAATAEYYKKVRKEI